MRKEFLWLVVLLWTVSSGFAENFKAEPPPTELNAYFTKAYPPKYPEIAKAWHKSGKGWFRLSIDRSNGKVTEIKVLQSTGVKILDDSIAATFLQWKAKPNMLDHAVIPFEYARSGAIGSHIQ